MADDPKQDGGGKAPKSPWVVNLTPINLVDGILTVLCVVTYKGQPPKEGTELAFNINGKDLIGAPHRLDKDGRVTVDLKVAKAPQITVKAKTVEPGGFGVLYTENLDASKATKAPPILDIEDNPLEHGRWLQTINIYDQSENAISGKLRLVPRKQFKLNGKYVPEIIPGQNPYVHDIDVPVEGITIEMEIEDRETEIDSYVVGSRVKHQFRLFGPGVSRIVAEPNQPALVRFFEGCEAEAKSTAWVGEERLRELPRQLAHGMIGRAIFAWISTTVLLVGLKPDWWALSLLLMIGLLLTAVGMIKLNVGMAVWNKVVIHPTMHTNNRLAWIMLFCWLGFTWVALTADSGPPLLHRTVTSYVQKTAEYNAQLDVQRRKNRKLHGRSQTNAQLGLATPTPAPTVADSVPESAERTEFNWRIIFWIVYTVMTAIYTIVARIDEGKRRYYSMKRVVLEKSEGTAGQLARGAVGLAASASGADLGTGTVGSFLQSKAREGARETFWNIGFDYAKKAYRHMKRW